MNLIASKQHLAGLLLIIGSFAVTGWLAVGRQPAAVLEQFGRFRIYAIALASEWVLFLYVVRGLPRGLHTIRALIDRSPWTLRLWLRYVLMAAGASVVWGLFGFLIGKTQLLRVPPEDVRWMMTLLPRDAMDRAIWLPLALSAGFCEEFLYRGYLLQQFDGLTNRLWLAIVLQALVYGAAHAALPWQIMVLVTFLGVLFGVVAVVSKSLVPGMMLHAAMDVVPGLVSRN